MKDTSNTVRMIAQIWAAVSVDQEDQTEGVCAVEVGGRWIPLIAADPERLAFVREQGASIARSSGIRVQLIRLHSREVVEELV